MKKTAKDLVTYCLAQVGRPYWSGGFGQKATKELYEQNKVRLNLPDWSVYDQDVGKKVHDCCGMIKGFCWTDGPDAFYKAGQYQTNGCDDWSVEEMYKQCSRKGSIGTMPEIPGVLLFNKSLGHVGIYIGNGELVEAHTTEKDVIKSKVKDRSFTLWGMLECCIDYSEPVVDLSAKVKEFQSWLNKNYGEQIKKVLGALLVVDGSCGKLTKKAAVVAMQVELNKLGEHLVVDGGCGKLTQAAMSRHMVKKTYRGNRTYIVQGLLYGAGYDPNGFDGSFGEGCHSCMLRYQSVEGLEVDGKVGGETLKSLVG